MRKKKKRSELVFLYSIKRIYAPARSMASRNVIEKSSFPLSLFLSLSHALLIHFLSRFAVFWCAHLELNAAAESVAFVVVDNVPLCEVVRCTLRACATPSAVCVSSRHFLRLLLLRRPFAWSLMDGSFIISGSFHHLTNLFYFVLVIVSHRIDSCRMYDFVSNSNNYGKTRKIKTTRTATINRHSTETSGRTKWPSAALVWIPGGVSATAVAAKSRSVLCA